MLYALCTMYYVVCMYVVCMYVVSMLNPRDPRRVHPRNTLTYSLQSTSTVGAHPYPYVLTPYVLLYVLRDLCVPVSVSW